VAGRPRLGDADFIDKRRGAGENQELLKLPHLCPSGGTGRRASFRSKNAHYCKSFAINVIRDKSTISSWRRLVLVCRFWTELATDWSQKSSQYLGITNLDFVTEAVVV